MRERLRRLPPALLACMAIAFVNGAVWAAVTPPLQVPDEIAHVGYVEFLVEWGSLPGGPPKGPEATSQTMSAASSAVPWNNEGRPTWSDRNLREFRRVQDRFDRKPGAAPAATINNAPLYYALEAAPYAVARDGDFFDRLYLMRLLSALLGAVTVAAAFLFVRELLPGRRWAPPVAALAVAFQPMFGYMSGGVNNDNLVYALGSVFIWLIAVVLRRGLTWRVSLAIALVSLAGMLTKTSFAGLLPGGALGILVALWRLPPAQRRRGLAYVGGAAAVFAVPLALWLVANTEVFDRAASTTTGGFTSSSIVNRTSLNGHLSYIWQVFLPPLPWMQAFPSMGVGYPLWDTYIQGFVGRFGWWRFGFPLWVNQIGLSVYIGLVVLAGAGLVRARAALRGRLAELLTYLAIAGGYVLLVEVAAYRYQVVTDTAFEQTRYLLPLLPLYGGLVAVAASALGRRWGAAAGAFFVVLAMTHSLFAMLLVIGHYYA